MSFQNRLISEEKLIAFVSICTCSLYVSFNLPNVLLYFIFSSHENSQSSITFLFNFKTINVKMNCVFKRLIHDVCKTGGTISDTMSLSVDGLLTEHSK